MSPCPPAESSQYDAAPSLGRIDQFDLLRELDVGAIGITFLAKDTLSNTEVIVRGMPPSVKGHGELKEGVRGNVEFTRRLHHPHIAEPIDLHIVQTAVYSDPETRQRMCVVPEDALLVTTNAPGESLARWRMRFPEGKVPFDKALDVVRQIAAALDFAHAERILHCAIMPFNVVVETRADGSLAVRVLDFGLETSVRMSLHGVPGSAYGKSEMRPYRAPEQWRGGHLHRSTDQYSLAVVFVELVTGEVPFAKVFETDALETMAQTVCTREPDLPEDCPRREMVLKALSKNAHERFSSCSEFVRALEDPHFLRNDAVANAHHHGERRQARQKKSKLGKYLGLLVVLVLAAGLGWAVWSGRLDVNSFLNGTDAHSSKKAETAETAAPKETSASQNKDRLLQIQQEIEHQKKVSDKALQEYRKFMETAGPIILEVKRDEAKRTLFRTTQEMQTQTDEIAAGQKQLQMLEGIKTGQTSLTSLSGDLRKIPELDAAYTNFVFAARRLEDARARYTEKHPEMIAIGKEASAAQTQLLAAVDAASQSVRMLLSVRTERLGTLRAEEPKQRDELARLEGEYLAAKTRQDELDGIRKREFALLSDLRRMEYSIRFGLPMPSQPSSTNTTSISL